MPVDKPFQGSEWLPKRRLSSLSDSPPRGGEWQVSMLPLRGGHARWDLLPRVETYG